MKIKFKKSAIKDLSKFNQKTQNKILEKIEDLIYFPNIANIKKLTNFYPPYRLRIGDYRVLFDINENIVIFAIKHRKDVYKWV